MIKVMLSLMISVSFYACDNTTTVHPADSNATATDSNQMILDSTKKIDSVKANIDTVTHRP